MDITRLDITILVATTIGVILMSFTFPALGLTGDKTNESDIPEFTINADRFDITGDLPGAPGSATTGDQSVYYYENDLIADNAWLVGDKDTSGINLLMENRNTTSNPEFYVSTRLYVDGEQRDNATTQLNLSQTETLETQYDTGDGIIYANTTITLANINDKGTDNMTARFDYSIEVDGTQNVLDSAGEGLSSGGGSDWYDGIPIVSQTADALSWVARAIQYIANVLYWGVGTFVELLLNGLGVVFDIATYVVDLLTWLTDTYLAIQSSSEIDAWASVILMIPAVIMMAEWAKIILVLVEVIWIG